MNAKEPGADLLPTEPGARADAPRVLIIGQKFGPGIRKLVALGPASIRVSIATLEEDAYNLQCVEHYLSYDVIVAPYRVCLMHLRLGMERYDRWPLLVLATGARERTKNLVAGNFCDAVIPDRSLPQPPEHMEEIFTALQEYGRAFPNWPPDILHLVRPRSAIVEALSTGRFPERKIVPGPVEKRAFIDFMAYIGKFVSAHGEYPLWVTKPLEAAFAGAGDYYHLKLERDMTRRGLMMVRPIFSPHETRWSPEVKSCFVIMPFAAELDAVFQGVIKPTLAGEGIEARRADDFFSHGSVMNDVWKRLNEADVIVADLTGRNPNVYYELGIAHTLGKPVILLSQDIDDIPFDIRDKRIIIYGTRFDEIDRLKEALVASIHEVRNDQERRAGVEPVPRE